MLSKVRVALWFWDLSERRAIPENTQSFFHLWQASCAVTFLHPCQEGQPQDCGSCARPLSSSDTDLRCRIPVPLLLPQGLWWPFAGSWCGLERSSGTLSGHMQSLWKWIQTDRMSEISEKAWICTEKANSTKGVSAKNTLLSSLSFVPGTDILSWNLQSQNPRRWFPDSCNLREHRNVIQPLHMLLWMLRRRHDQFLCAPTTHSGRMFECLLCARPYLRHTSNEINRNTSLDRAYIPVKETVIKINKPPSHIT